MPITPDVKDWTWVLERTCPECGFDVRSFEKERIGELIRSNAGEWPDLLADPRAGMRPSDDRWSALEYASHVRDVYRLYDARLALMLRQDGAAFENWDQDAAAVEGSYDNGDPSVVDTELGEAARALADRFDGVEGSAWSRTGHRSDGAVFTVETFARYLIHDPIHHVHDVQEGYESLGRV